MNDTADIEILKITPQLIKKIYQFFDDISGELLDVLEAAHSRYEHLIDVNSGGLDQKIIDQDRKEYPDYFKKENGVSVFNDDDCARFMSDKSKLPELLCYLFIQREFYWLIALGIVEDPQKSINIMIADINNRLKNNTQFLELLNFIYGEYQKGEKQN